MIIGYCLQGYPVKSQTWIPLEIKELKRLGHKVNIIDIEKRLNKKKIKECDHIVCHFSYQGIYAKRWGIPYGVIPHAYDIWKDGGIALRKATDNKNCKWVGYRSEFHKNKFRDWGVNPPLFYAPGTYDDKFFNRTKPLGDKVVAGGRNKEKKGLKYAVMGFDGIYLYGGDSTKELIKYNPKTNFCGWLTKEAYRDLLEDSWLYVCPCVRAKDGDMDGVPTTILEALAMELQVLTTDIAGIPDLKHIKITSIESIKNGEHDLKKVNNIEGRDFVQKNYNPQVCTQRILDAIESTE